MTEVKKNRAKIKEFDKKLNEKNKQLVLKIKNEFNQNKEENKLKNKSVIDDDYKIALNNIKLEIEKLKNKYELLNKEENECIKALKKTKEKKSIDDVSFFNINSFNSNNDIYISKKDIKNIEEQNNKGKNRSHSQIKKRNKNILTNENEEKKLNHFHNNKENNLVNNSNKEYNNAKKKNIHNQNNTNKENISQIKLVKKMNKSKSNFHSKISLQERNEKKKELDEKIKQSRKKSKSKSKEKSKGINFNSLNLNYERWKN